MDRRHTTRLHTQAVSVRRPRQVRNVRAAAMTLLIWLARFIVYNPIGALLDDLCGGMYSDLLDDLEELREYGQ